MTRKKKILKDIQLIIKHTGAQKSAAELFGNEEERKAREEKTKAILDSINATLDRMEENLDKLDFNLRWIDEQLNEQLDNEMDRFIKIQEEKEKELAEKEEKNNDN